MRPTEKNPPNRFYAQSVEHDEGESPAVPLTIVDDASRTIVSSNDSPDIGFRYSVNPYRGCVHACAYCYARPTHEHLGYGAGTDFDRIVVVKRAAPELLREAFEKRSWAGERVVFSGVTDPYQPIERELRLTRGCLEVCALYKNPVGVITKSPLVERDVDVLRELHESARVRVTVSIPFADPAVARALEPGVASPERRLRTISKLADAGIPVGISVSPLVPGLGDAGLAELLGAAARAGATHTFAVMLRLPGAVREVFEDRVRAALPLRAEKILTRLREMHGERLYDPRFGHRQRGAGPYAEALLATFESAARRAGLTTSMSDEPATTFTRPIAVAKSPQLSLFEPAGSPRSSSPRRP
jgi:DNA repair photolyase